MHAAIDDFADVIPSCIKLRQQLQAKRDSLLALGKNNLVNRLHLNKKNFDKFIFAIEFHINDRPYHINIAVFRIQGDKFIDSKFRSALSSYFDKNIFTTVHLGIYGYGTEKDGKEYHHFKVLILPRIMHEIYINQYELFRKLYAVTNNIDPVFKPIFGTMRFEGITPYQDFDNLMKYFGFN